MKQQCRTCGREIDLGGYRPLAEIFAEIRAEKLARYREAQRLLGK